MGNLVLIYSKQKVEQRVRDYKKEILIQKVMRQEMKETLELLTRKRDDIEYEIDKKHDERAKKEKDNNDDIKKINKQRAQIKRDIDEANKKIHQLQNQKEIEKETKK